MENGAHSDVILPGMQRKPGFEAFYQIFLFRVVFFNPEISIYNTNGENIRGKMLCYNKRMYN